MTTDFAVIWHEQVPPDYANYDIWARFLPDPDPRPIFRTTMMSKYPHLAGYWDPSIAVFHTNTVWTEQHRQNPPLYEVKFGDYHHIPSGTFDAGLYYSVGVGQDSASPYCVSRDGYLRYAEHRTDFGRQRLRYALPYLNPRNNYVLCAIIYREGQGDWTFDLLTDSVSSGTRTARPGVPETVWVSVPRRAYERDGRITCNLQRLTGEFVSVAAVKLYQIEGSRPPRGGGQSGSALTLGQPLLSQNAPNPFRTTTTIRYALPGPDEIRLEVIDVNGRLVRRIVSEPQPAGSYSVHWDGRDPRGRMLPTGVYFYRLQVGSVSELKRAILIR